MNEQKWGLHALLTMEVLYQLSYLGEAMRSILGLRHRLASRRVASEPSRLRPTRLQPALRQGTGRE